jgi:hypothetical protein
MALAQAILSTHPVPPSGQAPSRPSEPSRVNRDFTILRLLDDWGYQAVVRQRLAGEILPRCAGAGASDIGPAYPVCSAAARRWLQDGCVPPVAKSFGVPIEIIDVGFPWNRLFHVALDLRIG